MPVYKQNPDNIVAYNTYKILIYTLITAVKKRTIVTPLNYYPIFTSDIYLTSI